LPLQAGDMFAGGPVDTDPVLQLQQVHRAMPVVHGPGSVVFDDPPIRARCDLQVAGHVLGAGQPWAVVADAG